jgi:hypothetical protein
MDRRENIRKEQHAYKAMAQDPKRFKIPGYFAKEVLSLHASIC